MAKAKKTVALGVGYSGQRPEKSSASIANGVIKHAAKHSWKIVDLRSWNWEVPGNREIDGLIYSSQADISKHADSPVWDAPCRVQIGLTRSLPEPYGVGIDKAAVGRMAADYYLERKFRSFALAAYRADEWAESLRAFKEQIERSGGKCQTIKGMHLPDKHLLTEVRDSVRQQLSELTYPLGIFCANDRLALRLCHWCMEDGIAVPEQAAILGFGNDTIACRTSSVPLSSVNPDYEREGVEAAKLLQRMMDGEDIPQDFVVLVPPKEIVTRRSTDIMAVPDPCVARALRYIWDHYRERIGPADVAVFCGLPRRSLERHFKKAVGRTVMKEVMRQRLSKAREMLVSGDLASIDIAAYVGFGTPQYFNFQFKKKYGIPPQAFRERERGKTS